MMTTTTENNTNDNNVLMNDDGKDENAETTTTRLPRRRDTDIFGSLTLTSGTIEETLMLSSSESSSATRTSLRQQVKQEQQNNDGKNDEKSEITTATTTRLPRRRDTDIFGSLQLTSGTIEETLMLSSSESSSGTRVSLRQQVKQEQQQQQHNNGKNDENSVTTTATRFPRRRDTDIFGSVMLASGTIEETLMLSSSESSSAPRTTSQQQQQQVKQQQQEQQKPIHRSNSIYHNNDNTNEVANDENENNMKDNDMSFFGDDDEHDMSLDDDDDDDNYFNNNTNINNNDSTKSDESRATSLMLRMRGSIAPLGGNKYVTNNKYNNNNNYNINGNDNSNSSSKVTTNSVHSKQQQQQNEQDVRNTKFLVILVLIVSILGAVAVYAYSRSTEYTLFLQHYHDDAAKVLGGLGMSFDTALGALDSLAMTFSSIATASNQTYPFVTIPEYGIHIAKSGLPLTGSVEITILPIIRGLEQRKEWERYASDQNVYLPSWINETFTIQDTWTKFYGPMPQNRTFIGYDTIYTDFGDVPYNVTDQTYMPSWQKFPMVIKSYAPANWDWYRSTVTTSQLIHYPTASLLEPYMVPKPNDPIEMESFNLWCEYYTDYLPPNENCMEPMTDWYYPIVQSVPQIDLMNITNTTTTSGTSLEVKAIIAASFRWKSLIKDILPNGSNGLILVFDNSCTDDIFTYQINGPEVIYLGVGDHHQSKYERHSIPSTMFELNTHRIGGSDYSGFPLHDKGCVYSFRAYPSDDMQSQFRSRQGLLFAASAVAFILFPFMAFLIYDYKVTKQRKKIMLSAQRSNEIVSSLFPSHVRDRLYPLKNDSQHGTSGGGGGGVGGNVGLLWNGEDAPIAELYPDTTIMFADIAGFTAWSSVRDPNQVFTLLESIYGAFDGIAERKSVFKVETIGDCYVAVTGLPEPCKDHAVVMVKYAHSILTEMKTLTIMLERRLGPGTSSLSLRIGLNSGPTTAGVLRGSKGRFQLFGDTVNTAARMESNSYPGKIMCSEKTKELIVAAGKGHWLTPRPDLVHAKGKGNMVCYWCKPRKHAESSVRTSSTVESQSSVEADEKPRLDVAWMVKLFEGMLAAVVSSRRSTNPPDESAKSNYAVSVASPRDEVTEIIVLNNHCLHPRDRKITDDQHISLSVKNQLHEYISAIAALYRDNPFHNFEHACHVVMATKKLLCRVIQPSDSLASETAYGITSDPLAQFGIVFSALIHDVDHPGVSNSQLVKENADISIQYHNQSVAEQNSVTVAWDLLIQDAFTDLRNAIMPTAEDCKLFRQIIVNAVMATDLFDKDLKVLRENRWNKAFDGASTTPTFTIPSIFRYKDENMNRRATIVIEHIIQASDVSHTMQHWQVYQIWNRRLFFEMYDAYVGGRAERDPAQSWYEGEIWFFDNYIIPLAKKLKTCGVFGVSCDELLDYATDNRNEWFAKGREIVAEYVTAAQTAAIEPSRSHSHNDGFVDNDDEHQTATASMDEPDNSFSVCPRPTLDSTSITIEFESDNESSVSTQNDRCIYDTVDSNNKQNMLPDWDYEQPNTAASTIPYGM